MRVDEYLPVLQRANARFAEAAAQARLARGWGAQVPGCPDWTLADLVWHLAEVQHFWAWVVRTGAESPALYEEPARVADDELLGNLAAASAGGPSGSTPGTITSSHSSSPSRPTSAGIGRTSSSTCSASTACTTASIVCRRSTKATSWRGAQVHTRSVGSAPASTVSSSADCAAR